MKWAICTFVFLMVAAIAGATQLPPLVVPEGWGVNIHFRGEPARDLDMIRDGGFKFIRMDFHWNVVESKKGVYDFSTYDQLTVGLAKRNIRPLYILDYGNGLYGEPSGIHTEEVRQAFAKFAAAAAAHYKGQPIIWELWNEPNGGGFWKPKPDANEYMLLAKVTLPAMRKADPQAFIVAPAMAGMDFSYLETCFRQGLLDLIDGVTVHPYRRSAPETVANEYARLRKMMAQYSPTRELPILSGEWGYSTIWWEKDGDALQGQYIARQYMTNLSLGIPVSIWYDWHDDGINPKEPEHHFGTVTVDYTPKPSYLAAQRLVAALRGMHFVKRLTAAKPEDYIFLFSDGKRYTIAAWTTGDGHQATLYPGKTVDLTGDPQYIPVPDTATSVLAEAAWSLKVTSTSVPCGVTPQKVVPEFSITVTSPFTHAVPVNVSLSDVHNLDGKFTGPQTITLQPGKTAVFHWKGKTPTRRDTVPLNLTANVSIAGIRSQQAVEFQQIDPMAMQVMAMGNGKPAALLHLPGTGVLNCSVQMQTGKTTQRFTLDVNPAKGANAVLLTSAAGTKLTPQIQQNGDLLIPLADDGTAYNTPLRMLLLEKNTLIADTGLCRITPMNVSAATTKLYNDGNAKVPATFTLTDATYTGTDNPVAQGLNFVYDYGAGWKFIRLAPKTEVKLDAVPKAMGVWVRGDNSNCQLNMRFTDSTGRFFQATFGKLNFSGWRFVSLRMDDAKSMIRWGGTGDDSLIVAPLRIDTTILVDGPQVAVTGKVDFANFQFISADK
ncbi:MAG TPA: cellulase family glycosylhydrolase [Armatimonadota bacterium]|nr:cellulase family glycosylhydrolase [Armatimonadota bacterium]